MDNIDSTYIIYNLVPFGITLIFILIFIDVFVDRYRKESIINTRRGFLYIFYFYLLCLMQVKIGGISAPLINQNDMSSRFIYTNEWFGIFNIINMKITGWNVEALVYNFLIFIPVGIFITILFNVKSNKRLFAILSFSCLIFVIFYITFERIGLVQNPLTIIDICYLVVNVSAGFTGFLFVEFIAKMKKRGRK